jgi:hypothetical protein
VLVVLSEVFIHFGSFYSSISSFVFFFNITLMMPAILECMFLMVDYIPKMFSDYVSELYVFVTVLVPFSLSHVLRQLALVTLS